jgi:hypothetical protein
VWDLVSRTTKKKVRRFKKRGKLFCSQGQEITVGWKKFQGEELHNLYSYAVRGIGPLNVIKQRRMRGVQYAECVADAITSHWALVGNSEGNTLQKKSMCRRIILKLASKEQ